MAALHAEAASIDTTDWPQIAGLYAELWRRAPTPVVALAFAIAEGRADGPDHGFARLDACIADGILPADFPRLPATRAELHRLAGRRAEAIAAYRAALDHARHDREADFLRHRLAALQL